MPQPPQPAPDCTRFNCTDYDPCPTCLAEARVAGLFPAGEAPEPTVRPSFTPPVHYRRSDGVPCCVHVIPVGPDSCPDCRSLAEVDVKEMPR
jgi:hypothetical protein